MAKIGEEIRYRGWRITYDPPPIPVRHFDWQFQHEGYDGAPDSNDIRYGAAATLEEAKQEIDERIEEILGEARPLLSEVVTRDDLANAEEEMP